MDELKPCPFCGNKTPELVDSRVEFFVRCNQCKPFFTVVYGKSVRHLDHITADTDEDADRISEMAFDAVDWNEIKQSAIDAWNTRADGWISVEEMLPKESGRYWCYIEYQSDLGKQFYQWNCSFNNGLFNTDENFHTVTHWMPLPAPPKA